MKRPVFVNLDEKAIEQCLIKVGKRKLEEACKMKNLDFPKKKALFKINWNGGRGVLSYAYDIHFGKKQFAQLLILHNEELPEYGWEIEWYRY